MFIAITCPGLLARRIHKTEVSSRLIETMSLMELDSMVSSLTHRTDQQTSNGNITLGLDNPEKESERSKIFVTKEDFQDQIEQIKRMLPRSEMCDSSSNKLLKDNGPVGCQLQVMVCPDVKRLGCDENDHAGKCKDECFIYFLHMCKCNKDGFFFSFVNTCYPHELKRPITGKHHISVQVGKCATSRSFVAMATLGAVVIVYCMYRLLFFIRGWSVKKVK